VPYEKQRLVISTPDDRWAFEITRTPLDDYKNDVKFMLDDVKLYAYCFKFAGEYTA